MKMRETNFTVGRMDAGYQTNYGGTFVKYDEPKRFIMDK